MKLGYIHTDREEQNKVMKVLKMISEPAALDELGIGRIRDAFADKMFPGISTLQKRMKYFALLPQLYNIAAREQYSSLAEVRKVVRKLEIAMTKKLIDGNSEHTGITGINAYDKQTRRFNDGKFVKYTPAYIYNSGLMKYGVLRSPYDAAIYESSRQTGAISRPCEQPDVVELDFENDTPLSLELTKADAEFIIRHIENTCQGSLLYHLIQRATADDGFQLPEKFEDICICSSCEELETLLDCAKRFADFIYIVHVRYNCIHSRVSGEPDNKVEEKFKELYDEYKTKCSNIDDILSVVRLDIREQSCIKFCQNVARCLANGNIIGENGLDKEIINREKRVKQGRSKIGNKSYSKDSRVHYYKLTYRWDVVRKFVEELKLGMKND